MGVEKRNVVDGVVVTLFTGEVRSVIKRVRKGRAACGESMRQGVE